MKQSHSLAFVVSGIALISTIIYIAGIRVNTSESIPVGLYLMTPSPISKGEYVVFCPPPTSVFDKARSRGYINSGFCSGNYGYMMKKILAAKGDIVSINSNGVVINDIKIPYSKPLSVDLSGNPLPSINILNHTLKESEILLMTDQSNSSFDSRYFGFIDKQQVHSVIRPILIWK
ncbi:conjugative transfer signal peptidase TraF [Yersinia enterocolitica]|nr:conjugative transfer signal peptidase TraF [Yersinia enterocolitica]EME2526602.1 conjugative transfer signal peptidase TraF [Yersinia enterocolitica]